jgi:hypothetical protein
LFVRESEHLADLGGQSPHVDVTVEAVPDERRGVVEEVETIGVLVEHHGFTIELDDERVPRPHRHERRINDNRVLVRHWPTPAHRQDRR